MQPPFARQILHVGIALVVVLGCRCTLQVLPYDPGEYPYRTEHFIVYFDRSRFDTRYIESVAAKKERLLDHINAYLRTAYDGIIEVVITDTINTSHATSTERVRETSSYIRDDNGHEIAHIVSIQEWGRTRCSFLSEGTAVACERHDDRRDALQRYRPYARSYIHDRGIPIDSLMSDMRNDIGPGFDYSLHEYIRAGAFFHYLKTHYGLKPLREWYIQTVHVEEESREDAFEAAFGLSLDEAIDAFGRTLLNGP